MKLLLTGAYDFTQDQIARFTKLGYDCIFIQNELQKLDIDVSDIRAVICNGLFLHNEISKFKSLGLIQLTSSGSDRIPIDYLVENNIRLETARGVYSVPIAEWIILKILEIYKKSRLFHKAQKEHKWQKQRDIFELAGKTALIIGFGSIGQEVAKRLNAFDVKISAYDIQKPKEDKTNLLNNFSYVEDLKEAVSSSDIIILTLPLTQATQQIISAGYLAAMKQEALLINTSRGSLIDEKVLINTLNQGKFLGVALDVFENEPLPSDRPLWDFENVFITPHNAWVSDNTHARLFNLMYENLKDFIYTK